MSYSIESRIKLISGNFIILIILYTTSITLIFVFHLFVFAFRIHIFSFSHPLTHTKHIDPLQSHPLHQNTTFQDLFKKQSSSNCFSSRKDEPIKSFFAFWTSSLDLWNDCRPIIRPYTSSFPFFFVPTIHLYPFLKHIFSCHVTLLRFDI